MASVTIPARIEASLAREDGSAGASLSDVLELGSSQVPNLYSCSPSLFTFSFQERGVAYGETEASSMKAEATFPLPESVPTAFSLQFINQPVEKWGINFAGSVRVSHRSGEERVIFLPGTRTYDPAGITGDPHASERVGPSCSRTQLAVTVSQLVAAARGGLAHDVGLIQEKTGPLILRYHGRESLFDWMAQQVCEAVFQDKEVTPYPDFLLQRVAEGKLVVGAGQEHTQAYLDSYAAGKPRPPPQYYRKVASKDNPGQLLSGKELAAFNAIVS
jgi:hypothetical protein